MPRIRTIKPEFPLSESMGRVSRDARLLFIMLWTQADDAGRMRASPMLLANTLMPYDSDAFARIPEWLAELSREKCIQVYEVEGNHYLEVCKWKDHQRIDHPSPSKLPPFDLSLARIPESVDEPREDSRAIREDSSRSAGARADRDRDRDRERTGKGKEELSGNYKPPPPADGPRKGSRNLPSKDLIPSEPEQTRTGTETFEEVAARIKAKAEAADKGELKPDGQARRTNGRGKHGMAPLADVLAEAAE